MIFSKLRPKSLKIILSLFICFTVIVLMAILIMSSYFNEYNAVKKAYTNQLLNMGKAINSQIIYVYKNDITKAEYLAENQNLVNAIVDENFDAAIPILKRFSTKYNEVEDAFISTAEKNSKIIAALNKSKIGSKWVDEKFQENLDNNLTGKNFFSKPYLSEEFEKPLVLLSVPIKNNSKTIAILVLKINNAWNFKDFILKIRIGNTGFAFIYSLKGMTLGHMNDGLVGSSIAKKNWFKTLEKLKSEKNFESDEDGVNKIYVGVKNKEYGYMIVSLMRESQIKKIAMKNAYFLFIVGGIIILITIFLVYFFIAHRLKPLSKCSNIISEMKEGNLKVNFAGKIAKDEVGKIASSINDFGKRIYDVISDITTKSSHLATSGEEISATISNFSENSQSQAAATEEITATIEEISAGMDNIASISEGQFNKMITLNDYIKELSSAISKTSEIAKETVSLSNDIDKKAHTGEKSLELMNTNMQKITDSSKDMINIVALINDISDRINLLSLNAAIEAARAGEAGKGFAVVADEISKLADQTAQSINEIDKLIISNNDEINKGMTNVQDSMTILGDVISGVENINAKMDQISKYTANQEETNQNVIKEATAVKSLADETKISTEEMKISVSEIVHSISDVNQITQQNASGAEELTANSEEIAGMADDLQSKVSYFKI